MLETFEQYLERLSKCKQLRKSKREFAVKVLKRYWRYGKGNEIKKKISFIKMKNNPHLYAMFEWGMTKEGSTFWEEIANAGF